MPEGPSIVILKEEAAKFEGQTILSATSTSQALDLNRIVNQKVVALRSWGKHFLIELPRISIRVHFLLFGSYLIDAEKPREPKLGLTFRNGRLNLYAGSVHFIESDLNTVYDWSADVMAPQWDAARARKKLRALPSLLACDAILDQSIFAGAGNIIKNEVLFRTRIHPASTMGALPGAKLRQLTQDVRDYSFEFLRWKKAGVLKRHWLAHTKRICPRCGVPLLEQELGRTRRRSFFCNRCQIKYGRGSGSTNKKTRNVSRAKGTAKIKRMVRTTTSSKKVSKRTKQA